MAYNETFSNEDFTISKPSENEYEHCVFKNCTFTDISNIDFSECSFELCNLSNAKVDNTAFKDCIFRECKVLGVNFSKTKDFGFSVLFQLCNLSYTSFDRKKLYKSIFTDSKFAGANFTQADLSKTSIRNCDFLDAIFMQTNISGVDFTTNINFLIDPSLNSVKKAKFSSHTLSGLLYLHDILIE